ncbi:MAG: hypothetical protein Fur0032_01390 [Terrimicrobiaceae bacterium]
MNRPDLNALLRPVSSSVDVPALMELYAQPGVCGSCIMVGAEVASHDMPYSDSRIADFAARVDQLIASYERVGRTVWQVCAGFEKMRLLILVRSSVRMVLLIGRDADAVMIAGRAAHLLMEIEVVLPTDVAGGVGAEAVVSEADASEVPADKLRGVLLGLLEKVVGSAQADRLLEVVIQAQGVGQKSGYSRAEARQVGEAALGRIPNRSKRQALLAEFFNHLDS